MGLGRCRAVALLGVVGHPVEVEVDVRPGVVTFVMVGLPDAALSEARDRVRAAVGHSGVSWPVARITVSLSPAALPKQGSGFDLPIALALLAAGGEVPPDRVAGLLAVGELGLDGQVRPVLGVLPMLRAAAAAGLRHAMVPDRNQAEATVVPGLDVVVVGSLREAVEVLRGEAEPRRPWPAVPAAGGPGGSTCGPDLADVAGQPEARRALEVAAAGGHHLFLHGPPGAGKTMLAERLPGLLPGLPDDLALEVTALHSVAGVLPAGTSLVTRPPFQAPHHHASAAAIVGGGSGIPRPGAASMAHGGVLFLDEAPEFALGVLDALRQPLESGEVVLARARAVVRFPARFQLVLAANLCPCGQAGVPGRECRCSPLQRVRYLGRLSGPLLDRVDLMVQVQPVGRVDLFAAGPGEPTAAAAARVAAAREATGARLRGTPWRVNAEVPGGEWSARWPLPPLVLAPVTDALDRGLVSARGAVRAVRVAWTLADLGGRDRPSRSDVLEALRLRAGELAGVAA